MQQFAVPHVENISTETFVQNKLYFTYESFTTQMCKSHGNNLSQGDNISV